MTHKTPYELRAELLRLAYEICDRNSHAKKTEGGLPEVKEDDIIRIATKFNEFVSKNDTTKGSS